MKSAIQESAQALLAADPRFAAFRRIPEIATLTEKEAMDLYACFSPVSYPADHLIYEAGTPTQGEMFLILQGRVEARSPSGRPYARLGGGDVFGLFSFLDPERHHSATIVTITPTDVLKLSRATFQALSIESSRIGLSLMMFMSKLLAKKVLQLENEYIALRDFIHGRP